ncbi:hypothetical protein BH11PSE2_BH11PSE2_06710 [soil metagenome]
MPRTIDAFSNNDAFDFVEAIANGPSWDAAHDAFAGALKFPDELEYSETAYVIAAAAMIAYRKNGSPPVPGQLAALVDSLGDVPADLVEEAGRALPIARAGQIKFVEQWLSPEEAANWNVYLDEIARGIRPKDTV